MARSVLGELARINVVNVLETIHVLEEMLLPETEVLLGSGGMQTGMGLEEIRIEV